MNVFTHAARRNSLQKGKEPALPFFVPKKSGVSDGHCMELRKSPLNSPQKTPGFLQAIRRFVQIKPESKK
jgi:hypothetical protein